jgi:hypothetical protein
MDAVAPTSHIDSSGTIVFGTSSFQNLAQLWAKVIRKTVVQHDQETGWQAKHKANHVEK